MRFLALLSLLVALLAPASAGAGSGGGLLVIPRMGLSTPVSTVGLEHGPWLWHHEGRNIDIAGHRVTHTHPFKNLDRLRPRDTIYFRGIRYVVRSVQVLPVASGWVVRYPGLVLSACAKPDGHYGPPRLETMRLVVFAKRVR